MLGSPQPIFETSAPPWALRGAQRINTRLATLENARSTGLPVIRSDTYVDAGATNSLSGLQKWAAAIRANSGGCIALMPPDATYTISGMADQDIVLDLRFCSNVTLIDNGSVITTSDDLNTTPKVVYGALMDDSVDMDLRVSFTQSLNAATVQDAGGIWGVYCLDACRHIRARANMVGGLGGCVAGASSPTLAFTDRANDLQFSVYGSSTLYGVNFEGNGDNVYSYVNGLNFGRSWFGWGMSDHEFLVVSNGHKGALNDVLVKAYAFTDPQHSVTSNINGFYRRRNFTGDTPSDSSAVAISFDQDPSTTANNTARISNVAVTADADYAGLASPAFFAEFIRSGHGGVFDTVDVAHELENITLSGSVRNMINASTPTLVDYFSTQTTTQLDARNISFERLIAKNTSGAAMLINGDNLTNSKLREQDISIDGGFTHTNTTGKLAQSNIKSANVNI